MSIMNFSNLKYQIGNDFDLIRYIQSIIWKNEVLSNDSKLNMAQHDLDP